MLKKSGMPDNTSIDSLLAAWTAGDEKARDRLFTLMYDELYEIARRQRQRWNGHHTMNTTALVHGLYEKLARQRTTHIEDRRHFHRLAGTAIRHILVDYAKRKARQKRAQDADKLPLHELDAYLPAGGVAEELIDIDRALIVLEELDVRMARVVEMHFFAGLTYQEIGDALGCSKKTVYRDWQKARAILHRELRGVPEPN